MIIGWDIKAQKVVFYLMNFGPTLPIYIGLIGNFYCVLNPLQVFKSPTDEDLLYHLPFKIG